MAGRSHCRLLVSPHLAVPAELEGVRRYRILFVVSAVRAGSASVLGRVLGRE